MLGFTGSSESKLAAIWLEGLLDLPPNLLLVFIRNESLLPLAGQPQYRALGLSPLAGMVPACCRFRVRFWLLVLRDAVNTMHCLGLLCFPPLNL